jgi:hypothetical protein
MSENGAEVGNVIALPGEDTADLIATVFSNSDALLSVSSQQTLIM